MLGNCEKMGVLICSSTNEWSQQNNQILDDQKGGFLSNNINNNRSNNNNSNMGSLAAAATSGVIMEHHQKMGNNTTIMTQEQQKQAQNQEALRCPRCDSTNTKFCYYNNYSLSQPRHFCKACKRYWTRGGTLRNVPVGGGCRKNKRFKRPPNNNYTSSTTTNSSLSANNNNNLEGGSVNSAASSGNTHPNHIHDLISSASNHVNPLFYGLPTNHGSEINFPFSRFDLHSQNPSLGLGFSSSGLIHNMNGYEFRSNNNNGLNNVNHLSSNSKQIFQDLISSNPLLYNYNATTNCTTTSTISSLLASSLQMKNHFQSLLPSTSYEDNISNMKGSNGGHVSNNSSSGEMFMKDVKMEYGSQNRSMNHQNWSALSQNQMEHSIGSSSDPSIIWGSGPNLGAWLDPSNNLSSSLTSLI